jgi:hypothetical protein
MKALSKEFIFRLFGGITICLFIVVNVSYANIMGGAVTGTITKPTTLKVVLVQFADVHGENFYNYTYSRWDNFDKKHLKSYFEDLLASRGSYFGQRSFDLDSVHGSFRDYFWAMSRQTYDPTVTVLNNPDANGYPIWVTLSLSKTAYDFFSFINAARTAATAAGYNVTTSSAVRVCYIYAGRWCVGIDVATTLNGPEMAVPERHPSNRAPGEATTAKLAHIGYFCHEFVHMMGADHTDSWAWYWCLMRSGHNNGDAGEESANCPAPMNPWLLYKAVWASPITLNNDLPDAALIYSTEPTSPSTYYVRLFPGSISANDERLLVENRQLTNNYDQQLPPLRVTPPKSGGILIWRIRGDGLNENQTQLILADKDPGTAMENQAEDVFRPNGVYPYHKIFDHSAPATLKLSDSTLSHLVVDDYFTNGDTINIDFKVNYLSSKSSTATAYNSSRKLVRDSGSNYHLIYEAEGEINYQYSADGGNSWSRTKRLSSTFGNNKYPSITERAGHIYVVWQRTTDTNQYAILFRHSGNSGSSWDGLCTITSNISQNSDPLPVLTTSTPAASFEMLVAYRTTNGIKSRRSTSANGSSWASEITVTSNTSARNPSLIYKSNNPPGYFMLTWDDGNNLYHQTFNGTTWSTPAYRINNPDLATNNQYSAYALAGNLDRHIVWQAFDYDLYFRPVIYHNKNLNPTVFTLFANSQCDYLRPTGSGHGSGAFSVVWHDASSNKNIRKAYYNGSSWVDGQTGTIIASNGTDASLSVANPPGATAKAVWRSTGSGPYTLMLGPTGGLGKNSAAENISYQRRIIYASDSASVVSLQLCSVELIAGTNGQVLDFPAVNDNQILTATELADHMQIADLLLPIDADSLVFTASLYGNEIGKLCRESAEPVTVAFVLVAENGKLLQEIAFNALASRGKSQQTLRIALSVASFRGRW